jgi:hypothetical protein
MDQTAGEGTGVVLGPHGRLLGADADLARGRTARAYPAQRQTRGGGPRTPRGILPQEANSATGSGLASTVKLAPAIQ